MKISTRDLLAALMVEALADPLAAATLRCLATYCRAMKKTPPSMTVDRFLTPATPDHRDAVLSQLRTHPLLSWDLRGRSGRVTLATAYAAEWREITEKIVRFGAALEEWTPRDGDTARRQALRKGALLFNHQLFFEVHEVLEAQWMQEYGDEKRFLQGLIQIAVAFHHLQNRNLRGAVSLLQDGLDKLAPYQPVYLGIALQEFVHQLEARRAELLCGGAEQLARFAMDAIPRIQFTAE
jgi:predicted metal-dependent hydrolase